MSGSKCKSSSDVAGTAKKCQVITMETKVKIIEGVEQQEEAAAEEPKGFAAQEMVRGFLYFRRLCSFLEAQDQMQNSTQKLQQPFRLQSSSCRVIYDEERKKKKRATTKTSLDCFFQEGR